METSRTCRWVGRRLSLLAGGELAMPDRRKVERHLIRCPGCRARRDAASDCLGLLREVATIREPGPDSSSVWPALARQIRESRRPARPATAWASLLLGRLPRLALAAGLAAGGLAIGLTWSRPARVEVTRPIVVMPATPPLVVDVPTPVVPVEVPRAAPGDGIKSFLLSLNQFTIPGRTAAPREGVGEVPTGRDLVPARAEIDPFQPPLSFRLDYDLQQGIQAGTMGSSSRQSY